MAKKKIVKAGFDILISQWFVCRITSGRKSAQYGIRFSYPLYISLVALGIFLVNPYIVSINAFIAFLGIILPMHPFDYVYNFGFTRLIGVAQIPGRGSELQINSVVAMLFNLFVIVLITYRVQVHYGVMALLYSMSSIFFIAVLLFTDNFSLNSFFTRKGK